MARNRNRQNANPDNPEKQEGDDAPEGFVTMYHAGDATSFSFDGEEYEVVEGAAYIPDAAIAAAQAHGFSRKPPQE